MMALLFGIGGSFGLAAKMTLEMQLRTLQGMQGLFYILIGAFIFQEIFFWILKRKAIQVPTALLSLQKLNFLGKTSSFIMILLASEPYYLERYTAPETKTILVQRVRCQVRPKEYAPTLNGQLCFRLGLQTILVPQAFVVPDLNIREKTAARVQYYTSSFWGSEAYFKIIQIGREIDTQ